MKNVPVLITILLFLTLNKSVNGKCLKDIFNLGIGFTSSQFVFKEYYGESTLNSKLGSNLSASWIIFCPLRNIEIINTFKLKSYSYDSSILKNFIALDQNNSLMNLSSIVSYSHGRKLEFQGKLLIEDDLFFNRIKNGLLASEKSFTFSFLAGFKYVFIEYRRIDLYLYFNLGPRVSLSQQEKKTGSLYEVGSNAILKIGNQSSLALNFKFQKINHELKTLVLSKKILNLDLFYLFRF